MKLLEELRKQLAAKVEARNADLGLIEELTNVVADETRSDKNFTDAEQVSFDEIRGRVTAADVELDGLEARIAELEGIQERQASAATAPNFTRKVESTFDGDVRYLRPKEARDMALASLDTRGAEHLDDTQKKRVERLIRADSKDTQGTEVAKLVLLTENDAYRSAFAKATLQATPAFSSEEADALNRFNEARAASLTNAAGGYGVPVFIDPTIILTAQGSLNPFRKISRQVTITTNAWKGVSSAGVTWSYDAEATAVSDDAPTFAQPSITAHMARGFIPYSIEIGGDYPNFANEMATLLASGYDELQAQAFATGSGSGQPRGIITALDANTNVEVLPTTDGAFGAVDVSKLWGALPDRYKTNATWVMNHDVGNEVSSFSSAGQGSFYTVSLAEGSAPQLKGRPVEYSTYFSDFTGTTGASNIAVVGDFSNYVIVDRVGMNVELIPMLFDVTNNRPTGQRGWFAWARHGGDSVNDLAFRILQNA